MPKQIMRAATAPVRLLWRFTGKPIHRRLFGRYFEATISRLNSVLGELSDIRVELEAVRDAMSAAQAKQDEMDREMHALVAGYWDTTALSRRLESIETRIYGASSAAELAFVQPEERVPDEFPGQPEASRST